jgi:hypothetical protein
VVHLVGSFANIVSRCIADSADRVTNWAPDPACGWATRRVPEIRLPLGGERPNGHLDREAGPGAGMSSMRTKRSARDSTNAGRSIAKCPPCHARHSSLNTPIWA